MSNPTAQEQLQLEFINRLRTDPDDEYDRLIDQQSNIDVAINFFGVDLSSLRSQLDALDPVAPLAWNGLIEDAAEDHSRRMIEADDQSHQLPGEAILGTRLENAGYVNRQSWGENIYAYAEDALYAHAGLIIDWGYDATDFNAAGQLRQNWKSLGDGIQDPAGHRDNIMSSTYTETGIDVTRERDPDTTVGEFVVTQNFGTRFDYGAQFVGVVIDDADGDDFYDIGEGMGGVSISLTDGVDTYDTVTWSSGGWQIEAPAGTYTLTFSGGGLADTITRTATLGSENVKIDVEAADAAPTDTGADDGGAPESLDGREDALAVARLYGGAFGRQPDEAGVNFWIDQAEAGMTRSEASTLFLDSIEFTSTFGNDDAMTNGEFIGTMYQNVLGRGEDAGGFDYWVGQMDAGLSREASLIVFADSAENVANSAYLDDFRETSDGIWEFV